MDLCQYMATYSAKICSHMTSLQTLKSQLSHFSQSFTPASGVPSLQHSTLSRLCFLAAEEGFSSHSNKEIDFFSKKYDITLRLFSFYDNKGRKLGIETLNHAGLQLFAGLLYLRILLAIDQNASDIDQAKYINVCWKAFDNINLPDFLQTEPERLKYLQDKLFERLPAKNLQDKALSPYTVTNIKPVNWDGFKTLPIDVLFYEGPIARAYLETFYSLKCKSRRIHLIAERDLVSKKRVGRFMPSFFRHKYAAAVQSRKIHYWPQYLFLTQKKLCLEIFEHLQKILRIEQSTLWGLVDLKALYHYSDSVIPLPFTSLKDQKILDFINTQNFSIDLFGN
ncbi:hypothetical protein REG_1082 [Candidatus Regiella insecticola LSR1]|uniref:Uncharacterized protein n=1 Tax=Candidatus Regiella insecticola LSR1 TaxID=663321 RepID=E0WSV4_9ENTR|nr:hypothetical protein REG_1082 [Candidatus Regiella insecticola LSR1]